MVNKEEQIFEYAKAIIDVDYIEKGKEINFKEVIKNIKYVFQAYKMRLNEKKIYKIIIRGYSEK